MARFHIILGFVVCIACAIFFFSFPQIDINLASKFYEGNNMFSGANNSMFLFFNILTRKFPIFFSAGVLLFLLLSLFISAFKVKYRKEMLFVVLCLLIGPGLVVNVIFKDHWGRPRPMMIKELGGDKNFQKPFVMSSECKSNCSFSCGDASVAFWLFAFMPLVASRKKRAAIFIVGVLAGAGMGYIRMSQGGHFFSDVIFSGIFVYLTVWIIYAIMYRESS